MIQNQRAICVKIPRDIPKFYSKRRELSWKMASKLTASFFWIEVLKTTTEPLIKYSQISIWKWVNLVFYSGLGMGSLKHMYGYHID